MPNVGVSFRYGDHYEWNKVVTCIHNVFSQQRYLEHYGEVTIRNLKSNVCTCKITFVKVNKTSCPWLLQISCLRLVCSFLQYFTDWQMVYFLVVSILGFRLEQERGAGHGAGPKWKHHSQVWRSVARGHLLRHSANSKMCLEAKWVWWSSRQDLRLFTV